MRSHLAAMIPAKGQPFEIQTRPTPKPGPGELLIAVKCVALNPADGIMRDQGLFIPKYPTVIGFDISGLVLEVGDGVPTGSTENDQGIFFEPGITRVAAYSAAYWRGCDPDYGAFQERCLVPWQHAVPLPDVSLSWHHAATLPVAVEVPLSVWDKLGVARLGQAGASTSATSAEARSDVCGGLLKGRQKKEALLIWGASSSIGTMGVQSARLLREDPGSSVAAVYATAGLSNTKYVSSLGADRVFDHRDPNTIDAIVSAAKKDGLIISHCFLAIGQLKSCQAVLKAFLQDDATQTNKKGKIGSAPPIPADADMVDGVEVMFVQPSMEENERLEQFKYWMGTWLRENLAKGLISPSPEPSVIGRGLHTINAGLNMLLQGVSCTKLVIEVDE